jgi:RNA polymerase-binding protein DksA
MNKKILSQIKDQLTQEKADIEQEIQSIADKKPSNNDDYEAKLPDYGHEEGENANEIADFNDNLALEKNLEKSLKDTEKALAQIEKGTYGVCKHCGEKIDEKRLMARPVSTSCIRCKEKLTEVL